MSEPVFLDLVVTVSGGTSSGTDSGNLIETGWSDRFFVDGPPGAQYAVLVLDLSGKATFARADLVDDTLIIESIPLKGTSTFRIVGTDGVYNVRLWRKK